MKKSLALLIILFLTSCKNNYSYTFFSLDRKQCFTVISRGNIRYIIAGKRSSVPDTNYVKVSLKNIDSIGDEIVGCWKNDKYEWQIVNDKAVILNNKLDSTRFKFTTRFPEKDEIPTLKDFVKDGCFDLGFDYNELGHVRRGVIVN